MIACVEAALLLSQCAALFCSLVLMSLSYPPPPLCIAAPLRSTSMFHLLTALYFPFSAAAPLVVQQAKYYYCDPFHIQGKLYLIVVLFSFP